MADFEPGECRDCGMKVNTDAEAFLHACLHSGNPANLNYLPYALFPVVARLMEEYKRSV